MRTQETSLAKLTTVAVFPQYYFLENLAVRADGSILVTAALQQELWYIPPADAAVPAEPVLLHTFDQLASGIVETDQDVFHISTSGGDTTHESFLHRLDLRHWNPGQPVRTETVLKFGDPAGGLNGSCLLAPGIIVLADSVARLIWRVDLPAGHGQATARVWLKDHTMADDPDSPLVPPPPGVNGVRYAARTGTCTTPPRRKSCSCGCPSTPGRTIPPACPSLSRAAPWPTASASTRTPMSPT
jgi:hypothetical protein